jgi:FAD synthetase
MEKIIKLEQASKIALALRKKNKSIVLTGGCFDILHIGHITFLQKAKKQADLLFLLLEPDENITKSKGHERPINTQLDRAKILANLKLVDYVILLKPMMSNHEYDDLILGIKPTVIATTKGDKNRMHKERQAKMLYAKVIDVTPLIENQSTTKLVQILKNYQYEI